MGFLGGDVALIRDGAGLLHRQATALSERHAGVVQARSQGGRGCAGSVVAAALRQVESAYGGFLDGIEAEVGALARLAEATGADIAVATAAGQVVDLLGVPR